MTPSDYITEAKYDEDISRFSLALKGCESPVYFSNVGIWDIKNAGDLNINHLTVQQIKEKQRWIGHFIAAAINEKIQREKGEIDQYPDSEADGIVFCGKCGKPRTC